MAQSPLSAVGAAGSSPMAATLCGNAAALSVDDEDVRESLLRAEDRTGVEGIKARGEAADDAFTHEELLHSIGSFSAVVLPVTVTMLAASFVSINVVDPATAQALANAYLVYNDDANASDGTRFEQAMANALVIVGFFLVATFVIVACYKFNFNRLLIGYMMFSSAMLLGLLGGNILIITIAQLGLLVDCISFWGGMYNFAVVGVIAVFYQKGTPTWLAQVYLVLTSVIMAWQLGQFPEWSTWALVVVLAFYDLCAVLSPCGPLKWLVELVQREGRPLPGLLYEAEVTRNTQSTYDPPPRSNLVDADMNATSGPNSARANEQREKYYQCDTEIPLQLGSSPNHTAKTDAGVSSPSASRSNTTLRRRLEKFYAQYNPDGIQRIDRIMEQYQGREMDLWHDLFQKYVDHDDEPNTIKLGLGDFVFYSVLVSRAAMFDFAAMIGCLLSVLMGLGGTLILLGLYQKALPALPISILVAVTMYFWMRLVYFPFTNFFFEAGVIVY